MCIIAGQAPSFAETVRDDEYAVEGLALNLKGELESVVSLDPKILTSRRP